PMAACLGVVHLVGDDGGKARVLGQRRELGDEPVVVRAAVVGELHGKVALGKVGGPLARGVERDVALAGKECAGNLAVPATGEPDEVAAGIVQRRLHEPALEDGELLLAGEMATGDEPRERGVAGRVARQQYEVVARGGAGVQLAGPAAARPGTT